MARSSLDVFSPVRFDLSFDESIINADVKSDRGSFPELIKKSASKEFPGNDDLHPSVKKYSHKENYHTLLQEKPLKEINKTNEIRKSRYETSTKREELSSSSSHETLILSNKEANDTNSSLEKKDESLMKKTHVQKSKDERSNQEIKSKNGNSFFSSSKTASNTNNKTDSGILASKFITVRRERNKSNYTATVNTIPPRSKKTDELAVTQFPKDDCKNIQPYDGSQNNSESRDIQTVKGISFTDSIKPQKTKLKPVQEVDLGPLNDPIEKTSVSAAPLLKQSTQIQHDTIEKLISHTVSYEFDGIRQQLYSQQICILKAMHERMDEFESKQNSTIQALCEIVGDLVEENRKLKNALFFQ